MVLTWIDGVIFAIVIISMLIGIVRGFVKEAFSLIIWGVGLIIAIHYSPMLSQLFASKIGTVSVRIAISFAILLIVTLILGALVKFLMNELISRTGLSGTNRMVGFVFGLLRGIVLVGGLILLMQLTNIPKSSAWKNSILLPYLQPVAVGLKTFVPANMVHYFQLTRLNELN